MQWDTSEHDWLEGRGEKLYLIAMIDDATGELTARFARHDSTEENMRLLWSYLEKNGRPVAFVMDSGETYFKRALRLGVRSGGFVQVLDGVKEGERVVSRGAYEIKLSTAIGAIPEHGHQH